MHEIDDRAEFPLETSLTIRSWATEREAFPAERLRRQWVADVVETEVLPRLLDAHGARFPPACDPVTPLAADPDRLVALLRANRIGDACDQIEARLRSGASPQAVMIEDFGPAARKLGSLWDADECDIVDVSLGVAALAGFLRELMPFESPVTAASAPSILILVAPGETHELGVKMVESFFRSAGWRASRSAGVNFCATLRREWFDAVGFSISCERYVDSLERAVAEARVASRNPRLKILVGGAIFGDKPFLAKKIGADLFAANADAAINISRILLEELV